MESAVGFSAPGQARLRHAGRGPQVGASGLASAYAFRRTSRGSRDCQPLAIAYSCSHHGFFAGGFNRGPYV